MYEDSVVNSFLGSGLTAFAIFFMSLSIPIDSFSKDFDKPVEYAPIYISEIKPEPVSIERLQKGLDATYYLEFFERSLNELPQGKTHSFIVKKGEPITELNHQFGEDEVFSSGTNRGVAVRMKGYLMFSEKGEYQLQALSNDGVGVIIDGKVVISDPEQHSDRLSNIGFVTINQPGYYATVIEYFQRKGTAALKLLWKTPGSTDFVPVPANVYAHLP